MGKVILFTSGKGGSGTTTFTTNTAAVISKSGMSVLVVDLNIGFRNDDIYLGMENRVLFDSGDVLSGMCSIDKAIIKSDVCDSLFLLPCSQGKALPSNYWHNIQSVINSVKSRYDFILVDCPSSIGGIMDCVVPVCDSALLVMTADYVNLRNADLVSKRLYAMGIMERFYAINMISPDSFTDSLNPDTISKTLEIPLVGMISYDKKINDGNNSGVPIVLSEMNEYEKAFIEIAANIVA